MASLHGMQRVTRKRWTRRASQRINITFPSGRHPPTPNQMSRMIKRFCCCCSIPFYALANVCISSTFEWQMDMGIWLNVPANMPNPTLSLGRRTNELPPLSLPFFIPGHQHKHKLYEFKMAIYFYMQIRSAITLNARHSFTRSMDWTGLDWSVSGDWWWTSEWTHTI